MEIVVLSNSTEILWDVFKIFTAENGTDNIAVG